MATFKFSTLTNNQIIPFNPLVDILLFDTATRPAELLINGTASGVQFVTGGKSITLSGITLDDLGTRVGTAISNVQFSQPGALIVGEGTTARDGLLANILTGTAGDDALLGLGGNDLLDGGTGADVMIGGTGSDIFIVDHLGDIATDEANALSGDIDLVRASVSHTLSNYIENITLTGTANVNATGNALANMIIGNSGANILDGKAGADTMIGGNGNDTYYVDSLNDRVRETNSDSAQVDTVVSTVNFTLGANFENLTLMGTTNSLAARGNALNNVLTGSSKDNTLNGGLGADTMAGGDGNDTYIVDDLGDVVTESSNSSSQIDIVASSVSYVLGANLEHLRLMGTGHIDGTGNALNNEIAANAGNNVIDGGAGIDTVCYEQWEFLTLASSITTKTVTSSVDRMGVRVDLANTGWQNTGGSGYDKLISIENVHGSQFNDEIYGNSGNNVLDGWLGADYMAGGKGNDSYYVDGADEVVELANEGIDTVYSEIDYRLGANVEYLVLTGTTGSGTGNNLDNRLTGNAGANLLDGGTGADRMDGGSGNDTYVVDNQGDEIIDSSGSADQVMTFINYTLGSSLENLRLMGVNALNGTGNNSNNIIYANIGDNVMDGGNDTLVSGFRGDTLSYEHGATAAVTVDLGTTAAQSTGGSGIDTIRNFEHLIGSTYNDTLSGNGGANILDGGLGVDTVTYASATEAVTIDLNLMQATTSGIVDTLRNFENIVGSQFDDVMVGTTGTNIFDGGVAGGDTVSYRNLGLDEGGVVVNLSLTTAQNTQGSGIDTFISIEHLEGSVNEDRLGGNSGANRLLGDAGNDTLSGYGSSDSISGGMGDDVIDGGGGSDWAIFDGVLGATVDLNVTGAQATGYGNDRLVSIENVATGSAADLITGNGLGNAIDAGAGLDTLLGNAGDDRLDGGEGSDVMTGGAGMDAFIFSTAFASDNIDRITDFVAADDTIHLAAAIYEAIGLGVLKAADFQANASGLAMDASDRVIYETGTGHLYYDADGSGASGKVQIATLNAGLALTAADFFVF